MQIVQINMLIMHIRLFICLLPKLNILEQCTLLTTTMKSYIG